MEKAAVAHMGLMRSGQGADDFFLDNFELLKSLLAHASMGAGVVSDGWSRHLKAIQDTLLEIEKLYQEHMSSGTLKARDQFYARRAVLFARLDEQLSKMAAFGASLRNKGSIKRTLGISTKSYLNSGEISGYADKVAGVGKAARLIKYGSYIGEALGVGATSLEIQKACTLGREEECRKAKFVEGTSLAGGLTGASAGGFVGALIAKPVCVALGLSSGGTGTLACAVVVGAIAGKYAGDYGADKGREYGEVLYYESLK